ncbi:MAG: hypothetical protein EOO46_21415, partial [Flavobacterium sp.]
MLLKELGGDNFSSSKNSFQSNKLDLNNSINPASTKKSLEKLELVLNLARQNKRKDQLESKIIQKDTNMLQKYEDMKR